MHSNKSARIVVLIWKLDCVRLRAGLEVKTYSRITLKMRLRLHLNAIMLWKKSVKTFGLGISNVPLCIPIILNGDRGEAWQVNDPRITINASSSTQYHSYFDSPFNIVINHERGCPTLTASISLCRRLVYEHQHRQKPKESCQVAKFPWRSHNKNDNKNPYLSLFYQYFPEEELVHKASSRVNDYELALGLIAHKCLNNKKKQVTQYSTRNGCNWFKVKTAKKSRKNVKTAIESE